MSLKVNTRSRIAEAFYQTKDDFGYDVEWSPFIYLLQRTYIILLFYPFTMNVHYVGWSRNASYPQSNTLSEYWQEQK